MANLRQPKLWLKCLSKIRDLVQMMGVHQQLFGKRVLLDFKKKSSGQQAHIVT